MSVVLLRVYRDEFFSLAVDGQICVRPALNGDQVPEICSHGNVPRLFHRLRFPVSRNHDILGKTVPSVHDPRPGEPDHLRSQLRIEGPRVLREVLQHRLPPAQARHGGHPRLLVWRHGALGRHNLPRDQPALRPRQLEPAEPAEDILGHFARDDAHGESALPSTLPRKGAFCVELRSAATRTEYAFGPFSSGRLDHNLTRVCDVDVKSVSPREGCASNIPSDASAKDRDGC
ncbi:hypothetical protein AVEN_270665-1 [Araneus ventricosus]|uniref:Uncharacterized protein n=1 Tax=Araneus ventricosus TaxID=182803 RepID=A0A4Y2P939_ARAVE|nr:hypothetical protein AVEN_270665-1 [Araneus ventricosus]